MHSQIRVLDVRLNAPNLRLSDNQQTNVSIMTVAIRYHYCDKRMAAINSDYMTVSVEREGVECMVPQAKETSHIRGGTDSLGKRLIH